MRRFLQHLLVRNGKPLGHACGYASAFFRQWPLHLRLSAGALFFDNPQILDLDVEKGELIGIETLNGKINKSADILLLKTGFHKFRGDEEYSLYAPGIKAEVGFWLREEHGNIRAIGLDFVSLSSYQNREEGIATHKAFLDPEAKGNPILIVEDMKLSEIDGKLRKIIIAPLLIEGIDSAPCTVIGILE